MAYKKLILKFYNIHFFPLLCVRAHVGRKKLGYVTFFMCRITYRFLYFECLSCSYVLSLFLSRIIWNNDNEHFSIKTLPRFTIFESL